MKSKLRPVHIGISLCILAVLLLAANLYSSTTGQIQANDQNRTCLSYITEKIRQNDSKGAVSIQDIEGTRCLALRGNYNGVDCTTYIYEYDGLLKELFLKMNIKLVDFKIEFGKTSDGEIVLADEVSPDTCRLWDATTNEKLDKDRFRRDLGKVREAYEEILARLQKIVG